MAKLKYALVIPHVSKGVWLWGGDGKVSFALVHTNERDEVLVKPISCELKVVKWSTQKVKTSRAVQVLETKQVLHRREKERRVEEGM